MRNVVHTYTRYAIALLLLTLAAGVLLRAAFAWPGVRPGVSGAYMVHAHSHVGFFGWAVLAAFAVMLASMSPRDLAQRVHDILAHIIAAAALLAFIGFALRGYDTVTIALSAAHVMLWVVFAATTIPLLRRSRSVATTFHVAALGFLLLAGLATVVPVLLMVRGVNDLWLQQLGVKLFLTPFVNGFLVLTALGAVYGLVSAPRYARAVLVLVSAGTLPSTLLFVAAPPPAPWLPWIGQAGIALLGSAALLFAFDAWRARVPPLMRVTAASAAIAGVLELVASAGIVNGIMHSRAIVIAFMHIILLGVVTPALLHVLRPTAVAPVRVTVFAAGLATMTASLFALGWPRATLWLGNAGVSLTTLLQLAFVGGVLTAIALIAMCVRRSRRSDVVQRVGLRGEVERGGSALPTRA